MITAIDIAKLQPLLQDFYTITGIRITVFDPEMNELISWPQELPKCCKIIRSCQEGRSACAECDQNACRHAADTRETQVYHCHAGLTEAVTPLIAQGTLVGFLLFGNVFSAQTKEAGWKTISAACAGLHVPMKELLLSIQRMPLITEDYVRAAAQIMLAVASHVILERIAFLREDHIAHQLDQYLSSHFSEQLTVPSICRATGIGRTQLYEISRQLYGCGIAAHVQELRLSHAKKLILEHPELSLAVVADQCGFSDYNYFISVFTRKAGISPGAWRKQQK